MDEQEAKARCAQLAAEHPDRERNHWIPVKGKDGTWSVARIGLPPPTEPGGTEIQEKPRPPAEDPSSELDRSIRNFFYGGG